MNSWLLATCFYIHLFDVSEMALPSRVVGLHLPFRSVSWSIYRTVSRIYRTNHHTASHCAASSFLLFFFFYFIQVYVPGMNVTAFFFVEPTHVDSPTPLRAARAVGDGALRRGEEAWLCHSGGERDVLFHRERCDGSRRVGELAHHHPGLYVLAVVTVYLIEKLSPTVDPV